MTICFFDVTRNWSAEAPASDRVLTRVGRLLRAHCNRREAAGLTEFFPCQRACPPVRQQETETHDNMAARSARPSPAKAGKRRRESSEENTSETKAARKRLRESETTLERAERYRILTAKMPVEALTADWIERRNRVIQPAHVRTLCKIFQRGDMKRASHPLAVLCTSPEVKCMLHRLGYRDDDDVAAWMTCPPSTTGCWRTVIGSSLSTVSIGSRHSRNTCPKPALGRRSCIGTVTCTIAVCRRAVTADRLQREGRD